MSFREVTMFQIACDFPDCEVTTATDSEYYAWGDKDGAEEEWMDSDHGVDRDNGKHFCRQHVSDLEDGEDATVVGQP